MSCRTANLMLLVLGYLPLCAQQDPTACTRSMDEHTLVINIRTNHEYRVNDTPVPLSNLLSIVGRANRQNGTGFVYIIPEREATYMEVQALADRLLGSIPRLQVAFLQPPQTASDLFRCAPAAMSHTTMILQKIPK